MNKKIVLALVFLPTTLLLIWLTAINISISSMDEVKLRIKGYDPRDLFRGHYIEYVIDWENSDCTQFENATCPLTDFIGTRSVALRFYIPEQYAQKLDEAFRQGWSEEDKKDYTFEIIHAYKKGMSPKAKQLLINGKDWREMIKTPIDLARDDKDPIDLARDDKDPID